MRSAAMAVLLLGLVACGPTTDDVVTGDEPPTPTGPEERLPDTCKLTNYEGFVGQPLAAVTLPAGLNSRIVRPGTILTQEYVANRVNFHVDEAGLITKVICG